MNQKHLGNINRYILIFIFLTINIFANIVDATIDRDTLYAGEEAKLTLSAEGDKIEFPNIDIPDAIVKNAGSSSELIYTNGKLTKKRRKSFLIEATKDITIPSLEIKVDGKVYKTKPIELKYKKVSIKNDAPYILKMSIDKNSTRVGEPIELQLTFKIKDGTRADKINIIPPKLDNFWVKEHPIKEEFKEGNYSAVRYKYIMFPQKAGVLKIPKTYAQIGIAESIGNEFDDPFFGTSPFAQIRWKKIYSNSLKVNVEPLPNNLELYGHFLIKLDVPKKEVKANEPLNITIKVSGEGNFDDIKKFKLNIPGAMVYESEPKVKANIVNGKYVGELTQKVAIVADRNYTIPSISLRFFDSKNQKEVKVSTNPIKIKVIGSPTISVTKPVTNNMKIDTIKSDKNISKTKEIIKQTNNKINSYIFAIVGFLLGILTMFTINMIKSKKSKTEPIPIVKKIKKAKSDKELYKLLLPYAKDDSYIKDKLDKLEENIYKNAQNSIDKNELISYFEEIILTK